MKAVFAASVGAGILIVAVACTDNTVGSPTSAPTDPATMTPATSRLLPPRPHDLDITGVDPCKVLTYDQMHGLAYDSGYIEKPQPAGTNPINGGQVCGYDSIDPVDQPSRHIGTNITIATSEGADAWLTDPARKASAELAQKTTVEGFPALILPSAEKSSPDTCDVVVDVHDGQYLQTTSDPEPGHGGKGPQPACQEAVRVAGMAIQTIESQR